MDRLLEPTKVLQLGLSGFFAFASWLLVHTLLRRRKSSSPSGQKWGVERSNLSDEFDHTASGCDSWKVKSIWIYPVKSCRGVELGHVNVVPTGLEYDRQFMLAEYRKNEKTGESGWVFITQRQYAKMARITTELYVDRKSETGGTLRVTFPTRGLFGESKMCFDVPLNASEKIMSKFPLKEVVIWKDAPLGHDISSLVASELVELQSFLGAKGRLALFRVSNAHLREVYRNAPTVNELGWQPVTGFADAYPLHLMNLSSVRELNSRIEHHIPKLSAIRFRPNIIVSGPKAFDEDDWKLLSLGDKTYHSSARCVRCRLPNIDPESGAKHVSEPDRTMRSYRNIDEGAKVSACLGMQLVPADEFTTLTVGDKITVHERGEHFYIKQ